MNLVNNFYPLIHSIHILSIPQYRNELLYLTKTARMHSIKMIVTKPVVVVAALAFVLMLVSSGGAITMAFQQQHYHHHQRTTSISTTSYSFPSSRSTGKSTTSSSSSSLEALPITAVTTVAVVKSGASAAINTIGRFLFPQTSSAAAKIVRATVLIFTTLLMNQKIRQRVFWSGLTYPSTSTTNDIPPGGLGCPFIGSLFMFDNSKDYGCGGFYRKTSKALGEKLGGVVPKIWKYYFMGKNMAVVSGGGTFQKVLGMEFDGALASSGAELLDEGLMPMKSLLFEVDKQRHSYLRRLVGSALTPAAVGAAAPTLQTAAEEQVTRILSQNGNKIKFSQVCTDYTLDLAWRQILGLQFSSEEEVSIFEKNVATWIEGILSLRVLFRVAVKSSPGYLARDKVISKIEERIDQLLENGPDNKSTLSGMVFAMDDEDNDNNASSKMKMTNKRLSRKEIIDNALILIFAGSETSASILTNAMMFLGLHPTVWKKLVEEQKQLQQIHGDDTLTTQILDVSSAPFLDAVLKETLRMRTVVGGIPRKTLTDIEVDGVTIPSGWLVDPSMLLTHEEDPSTKLPNAEHLDAIKGFHPERWLPDDDKPEYKEPSSDWYVPYGSGPRYCLGKNLAQAEMKIFLATMARKIDFPRLDMIPKNDFSLDNKDDYFSVEWKTGESVIPTANDGVLAMVTAAGGSTASNGNGNGNGNSDDNIIINGDHVNGLVVNGLSSAKRETSPLLP
jgi:cytochrome P450